MNNPVKESDMRRLAEYQDVLREKPVLRYLFLELTDRCNLNCKHCGSKCSNSNSTYLDHSVIEKTLEEVAASYNPAKIMICITGGEPLLHPDIYRVIHLAHSLGFPVGLTSNGTLIGSEEARLLKRSGLNTITISIDGIGDVHNALRCSEHAFEYAIRGCEHLQAVGIEPQALTVVHKKNIFQLYDIYEFLTKRDYYSWRLTNVDPIGRAARHSDLLLDGSELQTLYDFIRARRFDVNNNMEVTYGCAHFVGLDYEREIRDFYFQCGAGMKVAGIMANGNIGACLDIERRDDLVQGSVYKDDFVDIWEKRFQVFRRNRVLRGSVCEGCQLAKICAGDSAHTWDYDNNEPMYCIEKLVREG